jgi:hypothetical protein
MIEISVVLLAAIALVHFYWALGGIWALDKALPTDTEDKRLVDPPHPLSALVGFCILGFAYVAYMLSQGSDEQTIIYSGWTIVIIFLLRSVGDFNMVGIFKKIKGTEFAKYDSMVYVPLCLFIGFGFVLALW